MFIGSAFCFIIGVFMFIAISRTTHSAIHEIESLIFFLISALLFSGAAVVHTINKINKKIELESEMRRREKEACKEHDPSDGLTGHEQEEEIPIPTAKKSWVELARED